MNAEKLLNEIGLIDDKIIAEANMDTLKRKSGKRTWPGWVSAAAACIIVAAITVLIPKQSPEEINREDTPVVTYTQEELDEQVAAAAEKAAEDAAAKTERDDLRIDLPDDFPELPMLTVSEDAGSYGFEGYLAYDINELNNGNPWSENDIIKTLPVFKNPTSYDGAGRPIIGLPADEMIQKARDTASIMGLIIDSVYTNPTRDDQSISGSKGYEPDTAPYEAIAICGDVTINVEANGMVRIFFENGIQLPGDYRFTYRDTTEQQANDVIWYLLDIYKDISGMKAPSPDLFGDYNIYEQRGFSFGAFECEGDITERLLGYNFNRIEFSPNEEGNLWIINLYAEDLSQKIGDYPIITPQKARELLLQKQYITTVPEELPEAEYIASVELIYRTSRFDEVYMPYYRFLVELPSMQLDNGLKDFGAFYVPAVDERYLSNMPLWNGSFN